MMIGGGAIIGGATTAAVAEMVERSGRGMLKTAELHGATAPLRQCRGMLRTAKLHGERWWAGVAKPRAAVHLGIRIKTAMG